MGKKATLRAMTEAEIMSMLIANESREAISKGESVTFGELAKRAEAKAVLYLGPPKKANGGTDNQGPE